tara:strand:- start:794 stop:1030 length:237 start_codon:yes stop_codon:yes gene_type:complete
MRYIDLDGPDGNAFFLLGQAQQWSRDLGLDGKKILEEMKAGDYANLCRVFNRYFGVVAQLTTEDEELENSIQVEVHNN